LLKVKLSSLTATPFITGKPGACSELLKKIPVTLADDVTP